MSVTVEMPRVEHAMLTVPEYEDCASVWEYAEAFRAVLAQVTNPYDHTLPNSVRIALGTAKCARCYRLSRGPNGCTAGC